MIVLWMSSILWFTRCSYALRESMEIKESVSGFGRLRVDALGAGVGLLHSHYSLDLLGKPLKGLWSYRRDPELSGGGGGVSLGSLNRCQYHPGVREDGFPSRTKAVEAGVAGLLPRSFASQGGIFPKVVEC
ncbi:hypothetical protein BHM03_00044055 [Ensete ventricosum]|nr:hypothetical protein BHM03_00044055 [Ensete ventricosum]